MTSKTRSEAALCVALFLLAALVRVLFLAGTVDRDLPFSIFYYGDSRIYREFALALIRGDVFDQVVVRTNRRISRHGAEARKIDEGARPGRRQVVGHRLPERGEAGCSGNEGEVRRGSGRGRRGRHRQAAVSTRGAPRVMTIVCS